MDAVDAVDVLATVAAKRQCQRPHDLLPVLGVGNGIWELGVACWELGVGSWKLRLATASEDLLPR